jgi:hypothetical protein
MVLLFPFFGLARSESRAGNPGMKSGEEVLSPHRIAQVLGQSQ